MLVIATRVDVVVKDWTKLWLLFVVQAADAQRATAGSQLVVCCGSSWRFQLEPTYVPKFLIAY